MVIAMKCERCGDERETYIHTDAHTCHMTGRLVKMATKIDLHEK